MIVGVGLFYAFLVFITGRD